MSKEQFTIPAGAVITGKDSEGKLVIDKQLGNYFATASKEIGVSALSRIASILAGKSETYLEKLDIDAITSPESTVSSEKIVSLRIDYKGQVTEISTSND